MKNTGSAKMLYGDGLVLSSFQKESVLVFVAHNLKNFSGLQQQTFVFLIPRCARQLGQLCFRLCVCSSKLLVSLILFGLAIPRLGGFMAGEPEE